MCVRVFGAATGVGPCFLPHSLPTRLGPFQHRGLRTAPSPPARRIQLPGADFNPPPGGVCVPRSPPSALALSAQEPLKSLPTKVRVPAAHLRLAQRDFLAPSSSGQQLLPRAPAQDPSLRTDSGKSLLPPSLWKRQVRLWSLRGGPGRGRSHLVKSPSPPREDKASQERESMKVRLSTLDSLQTPSTHLGLSSWDVLPAVSSTLDEDLAQIWEFGV